jgi:hypothetical protein
MAHKQNLHREKGFCKKTPLPNPNKQAQGASTPYRTMRHWRIPFLPKTTPQCHVYRDPQNFSLGATQMAT